MIVVFPDHTHFFYSMKFYGKFHWPKKGEDIYQFYLFTGKVFFPSFDHLHPLRGPLCLNLLSLKDNSRFNRIILSPQLLNILKNQAFSLFDLIFTSHQIFFSYVGTGLPGLNQY